MAQLSINAYAPIIRQSFDSYQERLQYEKEQFTTTEGVGFDKASFILKGSRDYLTDWFYSGLARHIEWMGPHGGMAYEGFVNRTQLTLGGSTSTRTLDGMANRILYVYTPLDTAEDPPTAEAQTVITENDTRSQTQWGIKTVLVSGNECPAATAADQALRELYMRKHIAKTETVAVGAGKQTQLKVEMLGYAYAGNWYTYSDVVSTGTAAADAMIALILATDPNSILSTDDRDIDACATAIDKYSDGKRGGWKMVQDIASRGLETGGIGFPWSVGVYEGRRVVYKAMEYIDDDDVPLTTNKHLALHRQVDDAADTILDDAGREVYPWLVRPDRLLYKTGVPGRPIVAQQVRYTSPGKVVINGTDRLVPTVIKWECG